LPQASPVPVVIPSCICASPYLFDTKILSLNPCDQDQISVKLSADKESGLHKSLK
jgi:hypothetical protein